jgi:hypothetical protein
MKKKALGRMARFVATLKAPRLTYLLRHPLRGSRNLLALRGAKSLLKTKGAAVTAAALATTAVAAPLAMKVLKQDSDS